MNTLKKCIGVAKKMKELEKEIVKLKPIVLTKIICNGGTSCTAVKDYEKQKTCFFYEKSPFLKKCVWLREEIEHCSNTKAQKFGK